MAVEPQTPIFSAGLSSAFGNAGIAFEVRPIWAFCSSTSIFSKLQRCQATSFCASLLPSRSQGPVAGPQAKSKACPCYQSHLRRTSGDSAPSQEEVELELPHLAVVQNKQLRTEVEKKNVGIAAATLKGMVSFRCLASGQESALWKLCVSPRLEWVLNQKRKRQLVWAL